MIFSLDFIDLIYYFLIRLGPPFLKRYKTQVFNLVLQVMIWWKKLK